MFVSSRTGGENETVDIEITVGKQRLFDMFIKHYPKAPAITAIVAAQILENNIICGDSLELMKEGKQK